jgi:hypothetical protein
MSFEYISHSIEAVQSINSDELGETRLEPAADHGGYSYFHPLTGVKLASGEISLGIKIPHTAAQRASDYRLEAELPSVSLLTERAPSLTPQVPYFIGRIVIDGEAVATLTEDVSNGGSKSIRPAPVSEAVRGKLVSAFCSPGRGLYTIFDYNALQTLAFMVDGRERLLDFTPSPIKASRQREAGLEAHIQQVKQAEGLLSVTISPDSRLAQALTAYKKPV